MPTSVTLPALGESVTEGTISRWLKQVGDTVAADEPLLEVSTDKVDTEIPSPAAGVLLEIKAEEDETVEVGAVLAIIGDEGEEPSGGDDAEEPEAEAEAEAEPEPEEEPEPEPEEEPEPEPEPEPQKAESKPAAKRSSGPAEGTEVTLPQLGESVTEGTVSRWLKQVGDTIEVDEALVEISTNKVDTEVPSPVAGTVLEIRAEEDESVEVGAVLAIVGDADAQPSDDSAPDEEPAEEASQAEPDDSGDTGDAGTVEEPEDQTEAGDEGGQKPIPAPKGDESESAEKPKAEPKQEAPKPAAQTAPPSSNKVAPRGSGDTSAYVTPLVRKLAAESGVDLASLTGTGVGGRIRKQDVLAAAEAAKQAKAAPAAAPGVSAKPPARTKSDPAAEVLAKRGTTEKLSRMRLTIAKRMVESLQVSAQLTATVEVDLTGVSRLRAAHKDAFKATHGASLSYLPFITVAAVEALRHFPKVNATIDTEAKTATYADAEHIGIAVDTERGLMVPVIHDAGDLNLSGLAKRIAEQADKARSGTVVPDDLVGGTFTITNYGSTGTLFDTPIINQPQVAILGTGALVKRPLVINDPNLGEVMAIRDVMYLSLTYDHRLVDGADASRFLAAMKERLEEADFSAELG
ncbi:2-oxoglutarate dehydrogenase, E2 component, dihydrolipoamide succinyltransferase [Ammonicoccus fulvus]|uniref:Dihydrolipoamide acetyltransferase component of pyruvate dehydrogenase complex n=1 Tax=Ammonicoccus fulvus TaxID=3138240 RepID=A0ABZ3FQP6_9ACTN